MRVGIILHVFLIDFYKHGKIKKLSFYAKCSAVG